MYVQENSFSAVMFTVTRLLRINQVVIGKVIRQTRFNYMLCYFLYKQGWKLTGSYKVHLCTNKFL